MQMQRTEDPPMVGAALRRMKKAEYLKLAENGFFGEERVELVFGMVVAMSPASPQHDYSTRRILSFFFKKLGEVATVSCQMSFDATEDSLPEPDIYISPKADYLTARPTRAHLVIEVSRSSAHYDRVTKRKLYALAEVDEYWVVDHNTGTVIVHRDRRAGGWNTMLTFERGDQLAMLAFPDVAIDVAEILPPSES